MHIYIHAYIHNMHKYIHNIHNIHDIYISQVFGGPAIGDIRARLTRLARAAESSNKGLLDLLSLRLDAIDDGRCVRVFVCVCVCMCRCMHACIFGDSHTTHKVCILLYRQYYTCM